MVSELANSVNLFSIVLSAFLIGFFASTAATGPVNFLVFRNALIGKYRKSVVMIFGSAMMEMIYCTFALTIVGAIILHSKRIEIISQILTIGILFVISIYLYKTEPSHQPVIGTEVLSAKENVQAFLTAFILVALNPTVILTWSAAVATLISFKIIAITRIFHIVLFVVSAGIGTITGSLTMVLLVHFFRLRFSNKVVRIILKISGFVVFGLAIYFLLRFLGLVS